MDFITAIEQALDKKAIIDFQPMQPGDVHETWADVSRLIALTGYTPGTSVAEGVQAYANWHLEYNILNP
jgi:UDP-glucuronate 4-epimerase